MIRWFHWEIRMKFWFAVAWMALAGVATPVVLCDEPMPAADRLIVLNGDSCLRLQMGVRSPELVDADGNVHPPVGKDGRSAAAEDLTPTPLDAWRDVTFDDRDWAREQPPLGVTTHYNVGYLASNHDSIWARAKFHVDDPAKAGDLELSLSYVGGVVVYVNGRELTRCDMPAGEVTRPMQANRYPDEAYVDAEGFRLQDPKKDADRYALRLRRLEAAVIPTSMLRAGVNVLAILVRRAPLAEVATTSKFEKLTYRGMPGYFNHCRLLDMELSAAAGAAVRPNTARPGGVQVWTADAQDMVQAWHYGDPNERPEVRLSAPRNATVSGVVVISSTDPLKSAKVTAGDLAGPGGVTIPASAVRVRYADYVDGARTFNHNQGFDGLLESPPAEVAVRDWAPRYYYEMPYSLLENKPVAGAMLPAWFSVRVPADARPGLYRGKVTASADGLEPTEVPVSVTVFDWRMPDAKDFVTHNNLYQSHESTALFYEIAPWSDRHFEMMGKVLAMSREIGNRICMVHLVRNAYHLGNRESMVRWIRRPDGSLARDYTIFDRYLDIYEKNVGKPGLLLLSVWVPGADVVRDGKLQNQLKVTTLDPATGETGELDVPAYGENEGLAFWKPVLDEVRERLRKRGWEDVAALGTGSDRQPTPETVTMFQRIWPEGVWMSSSHMNPRTYRADDKESVPVWYREHVWSAGHLYVPGEKTGAYPRPWKRGRSDLEWGFMRAGVACISALYESSRLTAWRMVAESTLQGNLTGVGRVGMDFWPIPTDGRRTRFLALSGDVGAHLGPSASTRMFVYPGPNGPIATTRFELFREGMQNREAMIFLQQSLDVGGLDQELTGRINTLLDERATYYARTRQGQPMLWLAFESGDWRGRDQRLYALCAEVAGKLQTSGR